MHCPVLASSRSQRKIRTVVLALQHGAPAQPRIIRTDLQVQQHRFHVLFYPYFQGNPHPSSGYLARLLTAPCSRCHLLTGGEGTSSNHKGLPFPYLEVSPSKSKGPGPSSPPPPPLQSADPSLSPSLTWPCAAISSRNVWQGQGGLGQGHHLCGGSGPLEPHSAHRDHSW